MILADLRATVTAAKPGGNLTASFQSLQAGLGIGLGLSMGGAGRSLEEVRSPDLTNTPT